MDFDKYTNSLKQIDFLSEVAYTALSPSECRKKSQELCKCGKNQIYYERHLQENCRLEEIKSTLTYENSCYNYVQKSLSSCLILKYND
jgi:hypothetical protein